MSQPLFKEKLSASFQKSSMIKLRSIWMILPLMYSFDEAFGNLDKVLTLLTTHLKPKDVRIFLGNAGYYIRFIKDFSKIASPLFPFFPKM
jgi:hypothetical protein